MTPITPIVVNCRDRVTDLQKLVSWLEKAGHERIVLLDNDSSYEPLLDYLKASQHTVVHLGVNHGSQSLWVAGMVPDERFVFTDPDILPTDDCPLDLVEHLAELQQHYNVDKAGVGFYLDDVPESMPSLEWERILMADDKQIAPGVYSSPVDTTFAVYRAGAPFTHSAVRTGAPYLCRHSSWYAVEPGPEDSYYLDRAIGGSAGSSWLEWVKRPSPSA
jgi:hypothetical protein